MTTEFQANEVVWGDVAGFGLWQVGHARQHLRYLNQLATSLHLQNLTLISGGTLYTSAPAVSFSGGIGFGARAVATISGGSVNSLTLTAPGTRYSAGDVVTVVFTGGTTGTPATAAVSISSPIILPDVPLWRVGDDNNEVQTWLNTHYFDVHVQLRNFTGITGVDFSAVDFTKPDSFYDFVELHNSEHALLDQAFGVG